jgi:hypothetical protein
MTDRCFAPFVWLASLWALRAILRARRLRLAFNSR